MHRPTWMDARICDYGTLSSPVTTLSRVVAQNCAGVPKTSAGLVMYRIRDGVLEMLLVHLGGPFWKNRDADAWFIPKGEIEPGEDTLDAARREFHEETGIEPAGPFTPLGAVKHKGGKVVHAWAFEGDCNPATIRSNTFTIEWPPRSGKLSEFPEIDRAEFFDLERARGKIHSAELELLQRLERLISARPLR